MTGNTIGPTGATMDTKSTSFKLELPFDVLIVLHSCAKNKAQMELTAEMHGFDGSKSEITVVSDGLDDSLSLTFGDKETSDIHQLLSNSWKCRVISFKAKNKNVPKTDASHHKVVGTIQESFAPVSRKRGRPPKRKGRFPAEQLPKRCATRRPSQEVRVKEERPDTKADNVEDEPLDDLDLVKPPVRSDDEDEDYQPLVDNSTDVEDISEPKNSAEGGKATKSAACRKDVVIELSRADVPSGAQYSGLKKKEKPQLQPRPLIKPQSKNCDEIVEDVWTTVVADTSKCRICDLQVESSIRNHVSTVHSIDWANYQHVVYVIERIVKLRYLKRLYKASDPGFMDPKDLNYSRKTALKALKSWREEHGGSVTGNQDNSSIAKVESQAKELKPIYVDNKAFSPCPLCEKIFVRKSNLKSHIRGVHGSPADQELKQRKAMPVDPESKSKYRALYELNKTVALKKGVLTEEHDLTKTVPCLVCDKIMIGPTSRNRLIKHLTETHLLALDKYQNLLKTTTEKAWKELIAEIQTEEREQKFEKKNHRYGIGDKKQCPSCLRYLRNSQNLYTHVKKLHANDPDYDEILKKVEENCSAFYKPNIQHREKLQSTCPYCRAERIGKSIVKHVRIAHNKEPDFAEVLERVQANYAEMAKDCESQRKMRVEREQRLRGTIYTCKFCQKEFKCRTTCHRHMRNMCGENPNRSKSYYCKCSRRFRSAELRDAHKFTCTAQGQDFMCHLCGKIYKTRSGLYCHKQISHSEKSYKHVCPVCNKTFFQRHHFDRHVAIHTEDRKWQCELCGKQYKTDDAVKKHQLAVHLNKYPYYCHICGHGMAKRQYLKAHRCGNVRRVQDPGSQPTTFKFIRVGDTKTSEAPQQNVDHSTMSNQDSVEVTEALMAISAPDESQVLEHDVKAEQVEVEVPIASSSATASSQVLYIPVPIVPGTSSSIPEPYSQVVETLSQDSAPTSQEGVVYATMEGSNYQYYSAFYDGSSLDCSVKSGDSSSTKQ